MKLKYEIKQALENISFLDRYRILSEQYSHISPDESFEDYDNKKVMEVINSLGYDAKYDKRENFFEIGKVQNPLYKTWFNISFRYGMIEPIWAVHYQKKVRLGSPWSFYTDELADREVDFHGLFFRSYQDLKEILEPMFEMYEDFKAELNRIYTNERIGIEDDG